MKDFIAGGRSVSRSSRMTGFNVRASVDSHRGNLKAEAQGDFTVEAEAETWAVKGLSVFLCFPLPAPSAVIATKKSKVSLSRETALISLKCLFCTVSRSTQGPKTLLFLH